MLSRHSLKIAIATLIASLAGLPSAQAQRHGVEPLVTTGAPPGLIKKIEPAYPIGFVIHGAKGRGRFRLMINSKSGLVDEVKNLQRTGYRELTQSDVKALLHWQAKPRPSRPRHG